MGKCNKLTKEDKDTIRRMTTEGYSQNAIADKIGCQGSTVGYHQKKMGLKASNKWKLGEPVEIHPEVQMTEEEKVVEPQEEKKPERKVEHFVSVTDKNIDLVGSKTNFEYKVWLKASVIRINPGYTAEIEIDEKDLVAFGNELLEIADMITQMRADKYSL